MIALSALLAMAAEAEDMPSMRTLGGVVSGVIPLSSDIGSFPRTPGCCVRMVLVFLLCVNIHLKTTSYYSMLFYLGFMLFWREVYPKHDDVVVRGQIGSILHLRARGSSSQP